MRSVDVSSKRSAPVCALAALLMSAACSDSHGGNGRKTSTETGNPPVIDVGRIALVVTRGHARVVGEPGAVTPGGGELEVEALPSGDLARGAIERDGSFDVRAAGSPYDTYALRAIRGGDAGSSEPVYVNRGGASEGDPGAGARSCEQRLEEIEDALAQAETSASRECDSSSDCLHWPPSSACPYSECWAAVTSTAGRPELDTAITGIETGLCGPFAQDGCPYPVADCGDPRSVAIACVDGQCTSCSAGGCPETTCMQCETPDVSWTRAFGPNRSAFSLTDCTTFTEGPAQSPSCSNALPCIEAGGGLSAAHLQNALGHPDVATALAEQARYGVAVPSGLVFTIRVGAGEIVILTACGDSLDCTDPPEGVRALRAMLEQIEMQQQCSGSADPACAQPFDPGSGPGTISVYAFHPQTGTCVQQVYTGAGGNDNRFDDVESCRAACPGTATASGCPPNRTFATDLCLACGTGPGGCGASAPACAKLCTTAADCAGEGALATCSGRGLCEVLCD